MSAKKNAKDRAQKQSVSFPPALWAWVKERAGTTGVPSRVVQEAVRLMMEEEQKKKNP